MMEFTDIIEWQGDSRARFIERALELESWGDYEGHPQLGRKLIIEVDAKITELKKNLNIYAEKENEERIVTLSSSNHILVYKKVYFITESETKNLKLMILDVRRFY